MHVEAPGEEKINTTRRLHYNPKPNNSLSNSVLYGFSEPKADVKWL